MTPPEAPPWPYCQEGATAQDPVGCRGIHVPGHTVCLAHLADAERDAYLAGLTPGASLDHRGTTFTASLLDALLNALRDPATGNPRLGEAGFESATFEGAAEFGAATFMDAAWFRSATFESDAVFESTFKGVAEFESATFKRDAWFELATFKGAALFGSATFKDDAMFTSATFKGAARFGSATFKGAAGFELATFEGLAEFELATFEGAAVFELATFESVAGFGAATFESAAGFGAATFESAVVFESATFEGLAVFRSATFKEADAVGPLVCAGWLVLSGATFGGPVTLSLATHRLECRRTRWSSTAEIRLRYATVDFAHAVFEYPLTIAAEPAPFTSFSGQPMSELPHLLRVRDAGVRMASLRGVDAAHLVLSDIDLTACLFTGTVHLDQIRMEGWCPFDTRPSGTHWRHGLPTRFTKRRILAEEHHWRAGRPRAVPGWSAAPSGVNHVGPTQLAPVYRALRKAFEDGKDEPGAADFYYGEMEMRRHDRIGSTRAERGLLHGYWLLSGYGLRASRALGWLAVAMLATILLLMGVGLAQDSPKQQATGIVPAGGGKVTFTIDQDDPRNPTGQRFTGKRFDKALNTTLNSVVFRSSGQDLTTAGTYIEMASRLMEPVLLGLAVLAVRNRVKR
ncbi:pentapeptide repeat-containing protein [Streptomyces sp. NPDC085900]|uniref:pentapeptide repeat-containing protein n=1 Tax=Streptomyces sp. NPDC085900 TaxID=3365737 RepID=UPI0037CE8264